MRPKRSLLHLLKVVSITLVLTACSQATSDERSLAVSLPTSAPSNAPSLAPSSTPTLTLTATPAPTPTPTYHPMAIPALRQLDYPGSDIVIERELEPGANYDRLYASYL